MRFFLSIVAISFFLSCNSKEGEESSVEVILVNQHRLDSIRNNSDTGYTRSIGAAEFNKAEQYLDKKDSIISKIMRDTGDNVVAVVQFKANTRITYEEYYPNGQLKGKLPLDAKGKFQGPARYYYEDGRVKSEGAYENGFFSGKWKNYDESGKLVSVDEYDKNGQLIKSTAN
jgi:antitoxin component YwqK of YwqJK toxin-antitoxin module